MGEEAFVAVAKIIVRLITGVCKPIFGTFAMTSKEEAASATFFRKSIKFQSGERHLSRGTHDFGEIGGVDIAKFILREYEVVATVDVTIKFKYSGMST